MQTLRVHPLIEKMNKYRADVGEPLVLRGFVGEAKGYGIVLYPDLNLDRFYLKVPEDAILDFNEGTGTTPSLMMVRPDAEITFVSGSKETKVVFKEKDNGPGDGGTSTVDCVLDSFERCVKDRQIDGASDDAAIGACTQLMWLFQILCKIGPLGGGGGGGGVIT